MKDKKDSRRKQQWEHAIDGKDLGERCISHRTLGRLRVGKS